MKLKNLQEQQTQVEEVLEEKAKKGIPEEVVNLLGLDSDSAAFDDVQRELKILKKTNPALYNKIVNMD